MNTFCFPLCMFTFPIESLFYRLRFLFSTLPLLLHFMNVLLLLFLFCVCFFFLCCFFFFRLSHCVLPLRIWAAMWCENVRRSRLPLKETLFTSFPSNFIYSLAHFICHLGCNLKRFNSTSFLFVFFSLSRTHAIVWFRGISNECNYVHR